MGVWGLWAPSWGSGRHEGTVLPWGGGVPGVSPPPPHTRCRQVPPEGPSPCPTGPPTPPGRVMAPPPTHPLHRAQPRGAPPQNTTNGGTLYAAQEVPPLDRPPPLTHGLGGCLWMHLVNSTGHSPVSGTADPRSSQTGQVIRGLR